MTAQHLLLPAILSLGACMIHDRTGPLEFSSQTIDLDASELVHVNLQMGAGDLRVSDGPQKLLRADFSYNMPDWKPEVKYNSIASKGNLVVRQPEGNHTYLAGNTKYRWDLQL